MDEVNDKNDIRNYTFHRLYHAGHNVLRPELYDIDGDGLMRRTTAIPIVRTRSTGTATSTAARTSNGNGHNPEAGETCMYDPSVWLLTVHVEKDKYDLGEEVKIVDLHGSRETHTYHADSSYHYELGEGCPDKANDSPLGHNGAFATNAGGHAIPTTVMTCTWPGQYYLTVTCWTTGTTRSRTTPTRRHAGSACCGSGLRAYGAADDHVQ